MKIFIVGPVASGKTTLARKLSELLDIPYFELDSIVHDDYNSIKRSEDEQRSLINKIIRDNKEWIIEGMPRTHLDVISANATLIIYLDFKKHIIKSRLRIRYIKQKLGISNVNYKVDKELYFRMLNYINDDHKENLKILMKRYPTKLCIIKNNREIKRLMDAIKEGEILKYQ